ncbi:hypothetical protein TNCV_1882461 [Trichonephila clavipes]|nr:hypothetical protein TNCV_1882461 [Trichonephila clavipes]
MDKPTTSSMADEHSCIICEKLGSSSEDNSDLGDIIKTSRGVTTLRTASSKRQDGLLPHLQTDVVYAHKSCRQKYINKKYMEGFCASYKEATLYEASATFATPPEIKRGSFAQIVMIILISTSILLMVKLRSIIWEALK